MLRNKSLFSMSYHHLTLLHTYIIYIIIIINEIKKTLKTHNNKKSDDNIILLYYIKMNLNNLPFHLLTNIQPDTVTFFNERYSVKYKHNGIRVYFSYISPRRRGQMDVF